MPSAAFSRSGSNRHSNAMKPRAAVIKIPVAIRLPSLIGLHAERNIAQSPKWDAAGWLGRKVDRLVCHHVQIRPTKRAGFVRSNGDIEALDFQPGKTPRG